MLIERIQGAFGTDFLPLWKAISFLGDGLFVFLMFSLLAWTVNTRQALQVGLVGAVIGLLVGALKVAVQQPRPYLTDSAIVPLQLSGGFGMPSGHSASVVGLFALLWLYRRNAWSLSLALTAILLVGLSRLYLGVHSWEQVVAGWALGAVVVATFGWFAIPVKSASSHRGVLSQTALAAACCSSFAALQYVLSNHLSSSFKLPTEWVLRIEDARKATHDTAAIEHDIVTTATFFEPHRVYMAALLFGMWLLSIVVSRGNHWIRFTNAERVLNVTLGTVTLFTVFATILLLAETVILPVVLVCSAPVLIALGVPWMSKRILLAFGSASRR